MCTQPVSLLQNLCLTCHQAMQEHRAVTFNTATQQFTLTAKRKESLPQVLEALHTNAAALTEQLRALAPTDEAESFVRYFNSLQTQSQEDVSWQTRNPFKAAFYPDYAPRLRDTTTIYAFLAERIQMRFTEAQQEQVEKIEGLMETVRGQGYVDVATERLVEVRGVTHQVGQGVPPEVAKLRAAATQLEIEAGRSPQNLILSKRLAQRAAQAATEAGRLQ